MIKLDMRNDREQKHGPSKRVVNGKAGSYEEIGNRQLINPHKKEKSKNGFKKSPVSNSQSKKDELGEISK